MLKRVGNYILEKKIGNGNYGEVYRGRSSIDGHKVAIKVMKRELLVGKFQDLLENEVKILETCHSKNIVQLHDIKKTTNNIYMIFEYCNEGDMSDYIKKKGHLSEEEAIKYFLEIINAFKVLVKNNVIHRDFKLANILKHEGSLKISDFGFSKLLDRRDMTQTIVGSPLNMAPEILMGSSYNNKVDVWSVGIVFYEMLFGVPPFIGTNMFELLNEIKTSRLRFPKEINNISPETEDILRKMLIVDPDERIAWKDVFKHSVTLLPKKRLNEQMEKTINTYQIHRAFHMNTLYYLMCESIKIDPKMAKYRDCINGPSILSQNSDLENSTSTEGTERPFFNFSSILNSKAPKD